jgi:hypothetical protein
VQVPLSQALTAPEEELPTEAWEFRQGVFAFMADRTLSEAAVAAIDGESPASRISRAGGKLAGGFRGEDRKNYPVFIARHFLKLNTNLAAWDKERQTRPAQFAQLTAVLAAIVNGGRVVVDDAGRDVQVAGWPRSLCELLADLLKERLRKRDHA